MTSRLALVVPGLFLIGCMSTPGSGQIGGQDTGMSESQPPLPPPTATGSYLGRYVVPTSSDLAAAATFQVSEVDWLVTGSTVTLEYALPVGLVGGQLRVSLGGQLGAPTGAVSLGGVVGTGSCTGTSTTIVTCGEVLPNLGVLPINMAVVRQTSGSGYAGPVADRVAVANVFSSDPIGFIEIDLDSPVPFGSDGHGGGGGPGGGGGGGGGGGSGHGSN
jgi:hypothetical protein